MLVFTILVVVAGVTYSSAAQIRQAELRERYLENLKSQGEQVRHARNLGAYLNRLHERREGQATKEKVKRLTDMVRDEVTKRFASLHAADCGSYECVKRKRESEQQLKRMMDLLGKESTVRDKAGSKLRRRSGLQRTKDYIGTGTGVFGSDYGGSNYGSDSSYGSKGWETDSYYYHDHDDDYYYPYYDDDDEYYYDDEEEEAEAEGNA